MVISFSGRKDGNCDTIAKYICQKTHDTYICFRDLHIHDCANCHYECFSSGCVYADDDMRKLYAQTKAENRLYLIVPIYCGNPCSMYYKFLERNQDVFSAYEDAFAAFVSKLFIIGVCGSEKEAPHFRSCLGDYWFHEQDQKKRVLLLERHTYNQKLNDSLLTVDEVRKKLELFLNPLE